MKKPTDELGRSYVSFMRVSLDQMRQNVADELYILTLFEVVICNFIIPSFVITMFKNQSLHGLIYLNPSSLK